MRGLRKSAKRFSFKLMKKILALIALILLTIVYVVVQIVSFLCRFVAIPGAIFGFAAAGYLYYHSGFSIIQLWVICGSIAAIVLYFLLPFILPVLESMRDTMKYHYAAPLIIRSPVRYTM